MSRRVRGALVAAVVAAVALAVANAAAAPPGAVGWWTQRPGAAPLGDGAIEIAASVRGEESIAAVRVDALPGGAVPARLVLTEAAPPTGEAAFRACPATSPWDPADGGDFGARPTSDCATAVDAVADGAGTWTIDLALLLAGGSTADVVLVPNAPELLPGLPAGLGFTISFSGIDVVASSSAAPSTTATPRPAPVAAPEPARPPASPAPAVRPSPVPAGVPTTVAGVGNDGTGGSLGSPVAPGATVPSIMFDLASDSERRPWGRLLLLVPLSAAAGFGAVATRNAARARL